MKYLNDLVEEKGLDLEETFTLEINNTLHIFDYKTVIDAILLTSKKEQAGIKSMLVKIDFNDGDIKHYFRHLAQALV